MNLIKFYKALSGSTYPVIYALLEISRGHCDKLISGERGINDKIKSRLEELLIELPGQKHREFKKVEKEVNNYFRGKGLDKKITDLF